MYKVIDDFLDKEDFIFIHNLIMNELSMVLYRLL